MYTNLLNTLFIDPLDTGPIPKIIGLTDLQIQQETLVHENAAKKILKINTFKKMSKSMIINAIENQYIENLKETIVGYHNRTLQKIFINFLVIWKINHGGCNLCNHGSEQNY